MGLLKVTGNHLQCKGGHILDRVQGRDVTTEWL